LNGLGLVPDRGNKFFSTPHRDSTSLLCSGYLGLFLRELKRPGCEADHLPPSGAEVKNCGAVSPPQVIHLYGGEQLIKHRDNFTPLLRYLHVLAPAYEKLNMREHGVQPRSELSSPIYRIQVRPNVAELTYSIQSICGLIINVCVKDPCLQNCVLASPKAETAPKIVLVFCAEFNQAPPVLDNL
jgi:hypothetical protein